MVNKKFFLKLSIFILSYIILLFLLSLFGGLKPNIFQHPFLLIVMFVAFSAQATSCFLSPSFLLHRFPKISAFYTYQIKRFGLIALIDFALVNAVNLMFGLIFSLVPNLKSILTYELCSLQVYLFFILLDIIIMLRFNSRIYGIINCIIIFLAFTLNFSSLPIVDINIIFFPSISGSAINLSKILKMLIGYFVAGFFLYSFMILPEAEYVKDEKK